MRPTMHGDTLNISFRGCWANSRTNDVPSQMKAAGLKSGMGHALIAVGAASIHRVFANTSKRKVLCIEIIVLTGMFVALLSSLGTMMAAPDRDVHYRVPPSYNPETETNYSFMRFLSDVGIWCVLTDLSPR